MVKMVRASSSSSSLTGSWALRHYSQEDPGTFRHCQAPWHCATKKEDPGAFRH